MAHKHVCVLLESIFREKNKPSRLMKFLYDAQSLLVIAFDDHH